MLYMGSNTIRDKRNQELEKGKDKKKRMQADFLAKMKQRSDKHVQDEMVAEVDTQPQSVIPEQLVDENVKDYKRTAQKAERRAQEAEAAARSEAKAHQATERKLDEKKRELKVIMEKVQDMAERIREAESTAEAAEADSMLVKLERDSLVTELERKLQEANELTDKLTKERDDARNKNRSTMKHSVSFMINSLRNSMSPLNLDEYEPLEELLELKQRLSFHKKRPDWYRETSPMLRERMYQSTLYDYGYMSKKQNDWYFINLYNVCYPLDLNNMEPVEDTPAKALLVDGVAYLTYVYHSDEKLRGNMLRNDVIFGKDQLNTPAVPGETHPQFGVSVLWLGYADAAIVNRFAKHGVTMKCLFPCKENDSEMRQLIKECHVVLVPVLQEEPLNYLRSNLNFQDEKVEVLNRVTVDAAVVRVRTACVRRGIIRPKGYDLAYAN